MVLIDWDSGNWPKCGKHGVSQAEIAEIFANDPVIYDDPAHSTDETRYRAIGRTDADRAVFVVFTVRDLSNGRHFRPVSARYMHQKEIDHYDKTKA